MLTARGEAGCTDYETVTILSTPELRDVAVATANSLQNSVERECQRAKAVLTDADKFARTAMELAGRGPLVTLGGPQQTELLDERLSRVSGSAEHRTIARTVGVVAGPDAMVKELGWARQAPTWATVSKTIRAGRPLSMVNPHHSTLDAAALTTLAAAATPSLSAEPTKATANNVMNQKTVESMAQLQRWVTVRSNAEQVRADAAKSLVITTEQEASALPDGTTVVYPKGPLRSDVIATMVAYGGTIQDSQRRVLAALSSVEGQERLSRLGFRTSLDGETPGGAAVALPNKDAVAVVLSAWMRLEHPGRFLLLMDVSGSMKEPVPPSNHTRMQIAQAAATMVVAWLPSTTRIGLWEFATHLDGNTPYRMVAADAVLSDRQRERLTVAAQRMQATSSDTAMYVTVLEAVRVARASYIEGQPNVVVLITDGRNDEPGGTLTLERLLATLKAEQDPERPVKVMTFAYGAGADLNSLTAIAKATGGIAYDLRDPNALQGAYVDALGLEPDQ